MRLLVCLIIKKNLKRPKFLSLRYLEKASLLPWTCFVTCRTVVRYGNTFKIFIAIRNLNVFSPETYENSRDSQSLYPLNISSMLQRCCSSRLQLNWILVFLYFYISTLCKQSLFYVVVLVKSLGLRTE